MHGNETYDTALQPGPGACWELTEAGAKVLAELDTADTTTS